jgi:hypothetical protein
MMWFKHGRGLWAAAAIFVALLAASNVIAGDVGAASSDNSMETMLPYIAGGVAGLVIFGVQLLLILSRNSTPSDPALAAATQLAGVRPGINPIFKLVIPVFLIAATSAVGYLFYTEVFGAFKGTTRNFISQPIEVNGFDQSQFQSTQFQINQTNTPFQQPTYVPPVVTYVPPSTVPLNPPRIQQPFIPPPPKIYVPPPPRVR